MNNIKILYYNIETIDGSTLEMSIRNSAEYVSHIEIKQGLLLVNFRGSARELYNSLSDEIKENSILIYDLDSEKDSYWGYMNKNVWDWIKQNSAPGCNNQVE